MAVDAAAPSKSYPDRTFAPRSLAMNLCLHANLQRIGDFFTVYQTAARRFFNRLATRSRDHRDRLSEQGWRKQTTTRFVVTMAQVLLDAALTTRPCAILVEMAVARRSMPPFAIPTAEHTVRITPRHVPCFSVSGTCLPSLPATPHAAIYARYGLMTWPFKIR